MKKLLSAIIVLLLGAFNAYGAMTVKHGSTSQLINIFISDSSSTSGAGKTGLLYTSTNLTAYYYCSGATPVPVTLATMSVGTWATGGFIQIDATNMPGWYQFGVPNAALVSGCGNEVTFNIFEKTTTALNVVPLPFAINLVANLESDTYAKVSPLTYTVANKVDSNTLAVGGTVQTARDLGASVLVGDKTGFSLTGVQTGVTIPTVTSVTNDVGITQAGADKVWGAAATVSATSTGVDAIWDEELTGATHNINNSAGKDLRLLSGITSVYGTVNDAAATTTSFISDLTNTVANFYKDSIIVMTSDILTGQARPISSYNGTTKVITVDEPWTSAPANTVGFTILSTHVHPVTQVASAVWQDATAGDFTTASSIGKSLYTSGAVPGSAGGVFIAGTNAATTVNITGNLSGSVGSIAANGISAASIQDGAITQVKEYIIADTETIGVGNVSTTLKVYTALGVTGARTYNNMCLYSASNGERSRILSTGNGFFNVRGFSVAPADTTVLRIYSDGCL